MASSQPRQEQSRWFHYKAKRRTKKLAKQLGQAGEDSTWVPAGDQDNPIDLATQTWRGVLSRQIAEIATKGLNGEQSDLWRELVDESKVDEWSTRVVRALVWRMLEDPVLGHVLAQFDQEDEATAGQAAAFARISYLRGMRIALGLGGGILAALTAIAVILAIG